jgi:hypothetical protein
MPPLQKCVVCGGEFHELAAASLCPFCRDAALKALKAAPHFQKHPSPPPPVPPKPDLATMKARIVCGCGWVVSGRSSDAAIEGYHDHLHAVHATGVLPSGPSVPVA